MNSFIITLDGKELVSEIPENISSGTLVKCAYHSSEDTANAIRTTNLVNAFNCKISHAVKWNKVNRSESYGTAIKTNLHEYLLK